MDQIVFNIVVGIAGMLAMFVLSAVWSRLGALEKSDKDLSKEIAAMHILVAGEYIKRQEITPMLKEIYDELKTIRTEISNKVERRAE